jgi:hypothetical protein
MFRSASRHRVYRDDLQRVESRSALTCVVGLEELLWHEEAKRNTHQNRNVRQSTLPRVTRSEARAARLRRRALGPRSTNRRVVGRKAVAAVAKKRARHHRAKAAEREVGRRRRNDIVRLCCMSHKNKSELVEPRADIRGALTKSGAWPVGRPGNRRSSGKTPSGINLDRDGGVRRQRRTTFAAALKQRASAAGERFRIL